MPIYNGSNGLGEIYYNGNAIGEAYYGSTLVYSNNKIVKLTEGSTWDVKGLYSKYNTLSVDNFFYLDMKDATNAYDVVNNRVEGESDYLRLHGYMTKTYDASTGVFSSQHFLTGVYVNVTPVLVTDTSKITYIGKGRNIDIRSRFPNYASLTANNFIVSVNAVYTYMFNHYRGAVGVWDVQASHFFHKEYNPSTGILSAYFYYVADANVDSDDVREYTNISVYYVPQAL